MLSLKHNGEKLFHVICNCRRNISCTSWLSLTHYDVLNIKRNSSQTEIRNAYIKLCKENHPDLDEKDQTLHKKFLRINEAYKVLSKPKSRKRYDESIAYLNQRRTKSVFPTDDSTHDFQSTWAHQSFYHNRKEEFMKEDPIPEDRYYGVKGIKRISNASIFVILVTVSLVSGFIQIFAIRNSMMASEYRKLSEENAKILRSIKKRKDALTDEELLEEIEKSHFDNLSKLDSNYIEHPQTDPSYIEEDLE